MAIIVPAARQTEQSRPVAGVRVSTDAPAEAFGPQLGQASKAGMELYKEQKQNADLTAFFDADLKAAQLAAEVESEHKKHYLGKDAAGAAQSADATYSKLSESITANLSPNQKDMVMRSMNQRRAALYTGLTHHADAELKKYSDKVTEDYITASQNDAVTAAQLYKPGDAAGTQLADQNILMSIDRQTAAILKAANENKMGPLWAQQRIAELKSVTHRAVIDTMLADGNDLMAQDYYKLHTDSIVGIKDVAHIKGALKEGSLRGESQRNSDRIITLHDGWDDRYAAAKEIADPNIRARTIEVLDGESAREKRIETAKHDKSFIDAANVIDRTGSVNSIAPGVWSALTVHEKSALKAYAAHKNDGSDRPHNVDLWTKFMFMKPQEIAKLTPATMMRDYFTQFDKEHYDRALTYIRGVQDAMAKGDTAALSAMQSDSDMVKNAYTQLLKKPYEKWDADQKVAFTKFSDAAAAEVQRVEKANGKKATDAEKQAIVRKTLTNKVYIEKSMWPDPEVPAISVETDDMGRAYVPQNKMPPERKTGLINWARHLGVVPMGVSDEDAAKFLGSRLERADGAGQLKLSDSAIAEILNDGPKMPPKNTRRGGGWIKYGE